MEDIQLTRMNIVLQQFMKIDRYKWYSSVLKEHAMTGIKIYGLPAPIFVAERIAYAQENDSFGMAEMKEFLNPLCNMTYILNRQTADLSQLESVHPKLNVTFDRDICIELTKREIALNRKLSIHQAIVSKLREIQEKCWSLDTHLRQRTSKLNTFLENNRAEKDNIPDKLVRRYRELTRKLAEAEQRYKKCHMNFLETLKDEKQWRMEINENVEMIRNKLTETAKKGLRVAYTDMLETMLYIDEQDGLYYVEEQIENFGNSIDTIVQKVLKTTSATYTAPIPEDFLKVTGNQEKLSKTTYMTCKKQALLRGGKTLFGKKKEFLVSSMEDSQKDECFFPESGGVYVNPVIRSFEESYGIMTTKPGYQTKAKLVLMNGQIGFGWSRKGLLQGRKKLGFFFLTPKDEATDVEAVTEVELEADIFSLNEAYNIEVEAEIHGIPDEWKNKKIYDEVLIRDEFICDFTNVNM